MPRQSTPSAVATIGIDIGKNTFHLVGLDQRGAIVLQLKSSREQLKRRLSNLPRCLIGMEACSGSHNIGRQLEALGHDVRQIPAQYVKPFLKGTRTTIGTLKRLRRLCSGRHDLCDDQNAGTDGPVGIASCALSSFVSLRTGVINQIRGFLIERGITVPATTSCARRCPIC
jgi:transposase